MYDAIELPPGRARPSARMLIVLVALSAFLSGIVVTLGA
jgi:hypothetical protein